VADACLLTDKMIEELSVLSGQELGTSVQLCRSIAPEYGAMFTPRRKVLRRLAYFSDKEGKSRVVAILDY